MKGNSKKRQVFEFERDLWMIRFQKASIHVLRGDLICAHENQQTKVC
jgi:hypothetical protein